MTISNYFINTIQLIIIGTLSKRSAALSGGPLCLATKRPIGVLCPTDGTNRIEWSKNGEVVRFSEIEAYDRFCTSLR